MRSGDTIRPSLWYCAIGALVLLAGVSLFLYDIIHGVFHVTDNLTQIVVPGKKDITLTAKTNYTIFIEEQSIVAGQVYITRENVSGLSCVITSQATGKTLRLSQARGSNTYRVPGREGRSVLEFNTEEADVYHFDCGYRGSGAGPQTVLAIGSGVGGEIFAMVGKGLASIFGGIVFGGGIILFVLLRRESAKKALKRHEQEQIQIAPPPL